MHGDNSNFGNPKWNTFGTWNHAASFTAEKSNVPINPATIQPTINAPTTEKRLKNLCL